MIKLKRKTKNLLVSYSFILPNFMGYLVFVLIPVVFTFFMAFMNWNGSAEIQFAGINNFVRMAKNESFRIALGNTAYYAIFSVPLTMVCSLTLAILLNKNIKGKVVFRTFFFFPYVASIIAIAVVWNMIFHPEMGPVNSFLLSIGIENPPRWSASTTWALPTIILASVWRSMGYYMVIYLAALQGIPRELYEAADIDGASGWQRFTKITFPMLTPATFFVSIMLVIGCFKVFDLIYVMTGGGPGRASSVLVMHIYESAFIEYRFGYASAVAMVLFLIVLTVTIIQFRIEKKWVSYM